MTDEAVTDEAAVEAVANLLGFKADVHTLCEAALLRVVADPLPVPRAPHRRLRGVRLGPGDSVRYRVDARGPVERELDRYLVRACKAVGVTREDLQAR